MEPACIAEGKGRAGHCGATGCLLVFFRETAEKKDVSESNKETLGSTPMGTDTAICFLEGIDSSGLAAKAAS